MARQRAFSDAVRNATSLLGAQIREGRIRRGWTVRSLAERAQISPTTLLKVEHGDPSVALGTAFDLAVLVGVPLFSEDREHVAEEAVRARDRLTLISRRVRPAEPVEDYDF